MRKKRSWKMWAVLPRCGLYVISAHHNKHVADNAARRRYPASSTVTRVLVTELKRGGKKTTSK